jgi:hypothetical protein
MTVNSLLTRHRSIVRRAPHTRDKAKLTIADTATATGDIQVCA